MNVFKKTPVWKKNHTFAIPFANVCGLEISTMLAKC